MSDRVPGECRSGDCIERAEFFAESLGMRKEKGSAPEWNGEFCPEHLLRVLALKLEEMDTKGVILIERMLWLNDPKASARRMRTRAAVMRARADGM
jgi:hypothetical protein